MSLLRLFILFSDDGLDLGDRAAILLQFVGGRQLLNGFLIAKLEAFLLQTGEFLLQLVHFQIASR